MTECLVLRYAEELPRLQAEQVLNAGQAALYPVLAQYGKGRGWWESWSKRARRTARGVADSQIGQFFFNDVPVSIRQLKRKLADHLGGGFSE